MTTSPDRRSFLQTAAVAGGAALLSGLPAVADDEAKLDPDLVRLDDDIEPLVRLLEDTPREKLLEEVGARVRKGLAYRDVLAALLLAGVRNVRPRPNVGFKFHAVLVVNSAHQAALAGPDNERWLPIFWALDNFKSAQATNEKESGWRMKPVDEGNVPPARKAEAMFTRAMTDWDEEKADVAAAALARHAPTHRAFDLFAWFGCRDFRDIGHKAIYVANAFRTLQAIGRQHAEPVYRSLAYALLRRDGDAKPDGSAVADKVGLRNGEMARALTADWRDGKPDPAATDDLLAALRTGSDADAADRAVAVIKGGVGLRSVWDAVFAGAGELLMRQPGIVGLHTLTTANALRYAFDTVNDPATRRLLLLQAVSFLPLFRGAMGDRGKVADVRIDQLQPAEGKGITVADVYANLPKNRGEAAALALAYLKAHPHGSRDLIDAGRTLVFLKGTDSHDYKFSTAVMEDHAHLSAGWKDRFLAAGLHWLKGSGEPDSKLLKRTRAALT